VTMRGPARIVCAGAALLAAGAPLRAQRAPVPAADATAAAVAPPGAAAAAPPLRLGVVQWLRTNREEEEVLVPPVYSNHLPKSLVFETLVTVDGAGRVRPGLAMHWQRDADGRRYVFSLRPGATFHDGSRCDAPAIVRYFESWLVRDVDRFVGACERIERLEAVDATTLAIRLREPYGVLCDLALMNPMGIVGGAIAPPHWPMVGTGPWRLVELEPMRRARYVRHDGFDGPRPATGTFEWITLIAGADRDPVSTWALERGHVDAVLESWRPSIPRDLAAELVANGTARLVRGNGSMVQLLCFNHGAGPFASLDARRLVRGAVDRAELVRVVEHGFARPCTTLFAPEIEEWPDRGADAGPGAGDAPRVPAARLPVASTDPAQMALAVELARQLRPHGVELRIDSVTPTEHARRVAAGEYDVYVTRTWGSPYDPQATLFSRFRAETFQRRRVFYADPALIPEIDAASRLDPGPQRAAIYERIQRVLDERVAVVPLYVPDRIALLGPGVDGIAIGDGIYGIDLGTMRRRP
jgi:ABC-type transport system substrate-binding protein